MSTPGSARQVLPTVPFIHEALGGSTIYEEHKGDLARARQIAETALGRARQGTDPALLADALLARGVVHLLQGEPPAALRCFQEIDRAVPGDVNRRLRAISLSSLATYWQFSLFPDMGGAGAKELSARWNGVEYLEVAAPQKEALFKASQNREACFESALHWSLLPSLCRSRFSVQTGRYTAQGPVTGQLLEKALATPADFRQASETFGAPPSLLAYADLAAADLCQRAGNMALGAQYLRRALEVYGQAGDAAGAAACHMTWGDWLAAPFSRPTVLNFALQEGNSSGSDLAWTLEAEESGLQGADLAQAAAAYAEAERLFHLAGAPRGLAQVHLRRGYLALTGGDPLAAIEHATRARDAFGACGDRLAFWLAQAQRVLARIAAGQFPEEQAVAEAMGAWGARHGSFSYALGLGILLGRAGRHWLIRAGDYERSLACYRLAEVLYGALGATANQAMSLADQGTVYRALGERRAALALYEQALDRYKETAAARPALAQPLRPQAVMLAREVFQLYLDEMNADGMERSAGRLAALVPEVPAGAGGEGGLAGLLGSAMAALLSGQGAGGQESFVEDYVLTELARSTIAGARVLVPLYRALAARDRGEAAEAARQFEAARGAICQAGEGQQNFLEATVLGSQKEYEAAAAAFRRYLGQGGANTGGAGLMTSFLQAAVGEQGRREAQRQRERTARQAFSFFVRVRAYAEAKAHLDELVGLAGPEWWQQAERPWEALSDCAELYEGLGDLETALATYDRAVAEVEARRGQLTRDELKAALAAGRGLQYLYFQAARTGLALAERSDDTTRWSQYAARAFSYVERGKARALLDLMAGSATVGRASAAEGQAMRAWRQCSAQLALWQGLLARERSQKTPDAGRILDLERRVESQQAELREIEAGLAQSSPGFHQALSVMGEILTVEQVGAALPPGAALLQYASLGEELLAWAIDRSGILQTHRAQIDAKALGRQVQAFHHACASCGATEPVASELAALLLVPLARAIQDHNRLVIVPYGPLHVLPFHALPWEGQPLAATHAVSYLPGASALQFVRQADAGPLADRILCVGNPKDMAYTPPLAREAIRQPALPAAATEATYVASLFPQGEALVGEQATEPAVRTRIGHFPLLHFASHGVLSEEAPALSAILLANGDALTVYELMGLELDADLVVLSACQTAMGEITSGNDVIGLSRGLLAAGARAAVVSLWPVNDLSTSLFMGEFYRQLRGGNPPAAALRAAQGYLRRLSRDEIAAETGRLQATQVRSLLPGGSDRSASRCQTDDYSHPFYWAPFLLIG